MGKSAGIRRVYFHRHRPGAGERPGNLGANLFQGLLLSGTFCLAPWKHRNCGGVTRLVFLQQDSVFYRLNLLEVLILQNGRT